MPALGGPSSTVFQASGVKSAFPVMPSSLSFVPTTVPRAFRSLRIMPAHTRRRRRVARGSLTTASANEERALRFETNSSGRPSGRARRAVLGCYYANLPFLRGRELGSCPLLPGVRLTARSDASRRGPQVYNGRVLRRGRIHPTRRTAGPRSAHSSDARLLRPDEGYHRAPRRYGGEVHRRRCPRAVWAPFSHEDDVLR